MLYFTQLPNICTVLQMAVANSILTHNSPLNFDRTLGAIYYIIIFCKMG